MDFFLTDGLRGNQNNGPGHSRLYPISRIPAVSPQEAVIFQIGAKEMSFAAQLNGNPDGENTEQGQPKNPMI